LLAAVGHARIIAEPLPVPVPPQNRHKALAFQRSALHVALSVGSGLRRRCRWSNLGEPFSVGGLAITGLVRRFLGREMPNAGPSRDVCRMLFVRGGSLTSVSSVALIECCFRWYCRAFQSGSSRVACLQQWLAFRCYSEFLAASLVGTWCKASVLSGACLAIWFRCLCCQPPRHASELSSTTHSQVGFPWWPSAAGREAARIFPLTLLPCFRRVGHVI
jgi:hypothetical protein